MSETAVRIPIAEASAIARDLCALLEPYCEQLVVCGSIRRRAPTVGDLDLVCIPRFEYENDLFGEPTTAIDLLDRRLDELWRDRVIEQRINKKGNASWGTRAKRGIYRGLNVDINAVDPEVFGMWMVVRTGPSGYSHAFVTPRGQKAAIRRGAEIVDWRDGMLPWGFEVKDGAKDQSGFRLYRGGGFIPTPTEADVYRALGWRYPEPGERR